MLKTISSLFVAGICVIFSGIAMSEESKLDDTVLTIKGKIREFNTENKEPRVVNGKLELVTEKVMTLSLREIESIGMETVNTENPWAKGVHKYEGPYLRALLEYVGAYGRNLKVKALNDYVANIPASDADEHSPILAIKTDGAWMPVEDKGPMFLVYDFNGKPDELRNERFYSRSIWQIKEILVE